MGDERSLRERSRCYLAWGWPVVPIKPGAKEPHDELLRDLYGDTRLKHLRLAPALPVEVEYWFENDPDINLAVIPCVAAGLVIVDVDRPTLLDVDPVTPTVSTGRKGGGKHFYFASTKVVPMEKVTWGDVNPSYVLLPGSLHPDGAVYEWLPDRSPDDVAFMPFEQAAPRFGIQVEGSG